MLKRLPGDVWSVFLDMSKILDPEVDLRIGQTGHLTVQPPGYRGNPESAI